MDNLKNENVKGGGQLKPDIKQILDVRCELVNETEKSVDIYMYGRIVDQQPIDWWTGEPVPGDFIYPEDVRNLVKEAGEREINLHINSTGGSIYASIAINNFLKQCKNRINVYIDGIAASGASIIAMAGDEINMPSNTTMMIHRAAAGVYGNAEDFRKAAHTLDKFDETVLNSYKSRFVGTVEELKNLIKEETYLTAEECKVFGLCDNILEEMEDKLDAENNADIKVSLFEKYKITAEEKNTKETLFKKFNKNGGNNE
ncbi:Clp protease ClpP [Sedimentibacter hydroxybenzoicus DSM 7310]|uniref:ATP-dependent Clp protease proteolytic subunit n=1 Tax=Sedimentibacter hydroxybenzoicus DSM 7310 TaxID=1123245 RepID=A0A974BJ63_SEDHY|nr:Clp protease ClpP [Sedimentibacter hydroxybenzoicus DSM 7310]